MAGLSYSAEQVRRHDHDRYLTALFVPAARREAVFALYAFNLEVARTREVVSEPLLGEVRLTWWREAIDELVRGEAREHPVLQALAQPLRAHSLEPGLFQRLIEARRFDLSDEPPATFEALENYAGESTVPLLMLVQAVLGHGGDATPDVARHVGVAWALLGLIRALPFHARAGRHYLPADLLAAAGVDRGALAAAPWQAGTPPVLRPAIGALVVAIEGHLTEARRRRALVPTQARPGLLLATLADAYLRDLRRAGNDPTRMRLPLPGRALRLAIAAMRRRY